MADMTDRVDAAIEFTWRVDSAIRSDASSNLGVSRLHSFDSLVDNAIMSSSDSSIRRSLVTSPVHTFAFPFIVDPLPHSRHHHYDYSDCDVWTEPETEEPSSGFVHHSFHIYNLSLNGNETFPSWQKGGILQDGGFPFLYEGITEDNTCIFFSQSFGNFFTVKVASLLDHGAHGRESILQLEQEISLLSQFQHDNIVRYLGTEKDNDTLYIFIELFTKRSLRSLYQKYRLRDSEVSAYTRKILSGLKYLHDRNVVHRDIKCANILVDANSSVKLSNFGMAEVTKSNDVKSINGSVFWMAPEVVNPRNGGYGLAADIWSLGCTVLEMLTRQPPYFHLEGMQAIFRIGSGQPPPVPDSLSTDARDFIHKCLQVNPNKRPTAAQLLDHPFAK